MTQLAATAPVVATAPPKKKRRSIAVTILIVFGFIAALFWLVTGVITLALANVLSGGTTQPLVNGVHLTAQGVDVLLGLVSVGSAILAFLILNGMRHLRRWAWVAMVTWLALGLVLNLLRWLNGTPNYLGMVLSLVMVILINQMEVRKAFQIRLTDEEDNEPTSSRNPIDSD